MRIAVLVYGRLNNCSKHYNNIIESLNHPKDNIDFFLSSDDSPTELVDEFVKLYKPIGYINSKIQYDFDLGKYPGRRPETSIHNMTCHFINKYRVFKILNIYVEKTNINYDIVLSLRIDVVIQNKFNFNDLENNTVYIPLGCDYVNKGMNDQIAYGKKDSMEKYNNVISNVFNLLENNLTIPHPESINYANIWFNKLNVQRVDLKYYLDK